MSNPTIDGAHVAVDAFLSSHTFSQNSSAKGASYLDWIKLKYPKEVQTFYSTISDPHYTLYLSCFSGTGRELVFKVPLNSGKRISISVTINL
jgi:hypothetical protein